MKVVLLLALLISSAIAAEKVTVFESSLPMTRDYMETDARFYMDTQTGMGYADISVDEMRLDYNHYPYPIPRRGGMRCDRFGCYGYPTPMPPMPTRIPYRVLSKRVEISNLNLVDKVMIYNDVNGEVNCGKLGTSRVLRRPTIYLSGKCTLKSYITRNNKLVVDFIVK